MPQRPIGGLAAFVTLPQLDCEQNGETRSNELVSAITRCRRKAVPRESDALRQPRLPARRQRVRSQAQIN
jgi:hypothetical protein